MGRSRSRSRSASRSPSRRRDHHHHHRSSSRRDDYGAPSSSSSKARSSYRSSSRRSRSRSRSPATSRQHRHDSGSGSTSLTSRRRASSDVDKSDTQQRKRARIDEQPSAAAAAAPSTSPVDVKQVKAQTVEKNGEISMTIDETNRVRLALGLKPLSIGPSATSRNSSSSASDANVVNLQKTSAQVDAERAGVEQKRKLAQSKTRRALTAKLAGQSIGEQLSASAAASALDWVKQSRKQVDAAAGATESASKDRTASATYDAAALAGLVVAHDATAFDDGNSVVLTLQDAPVLAADGNDVNDAPDALVNVEMLEQMRRAATQQQQQRALRPAYSGVDDDEFISIGSRRNKPVRLLAQYDDDADRKAHVAAQQFTLDATGSAAAGTGANAATASDGQGVDTDDVAVVSLAIDKTKRMTEYLTADEVAATFAKAKRKKLRKKKSKVTVSDGQADGDTDMDAATLVQQLEAEALEHAARDRGRRRRRITDDDDDDGTAVDDDVQLQRFQDARDRANATATNALNAMNRKRRVAAATDNDNDDDAAVDADAALDAELNASLARTRQRAAAAVATTAEPTESSKSPASAITSEERIAALVRQTVGLDASEAPASAASSTVPTESAVAPSTVSVGHVFGTAPQTLSANSNTVVFNDATDFEARLKSAIAQRSLQFQAVAPSLTTTPAGPAVLATTETASTATHDDEMKRDASDSDNDSGDDASNWGSEQPLVASGMAATLALLRTTGELRDTRVEKQAGRANDERDRDVDDALRIKDGVKLDYRDEFGRLLTKKEAFRMLSYKFHGHAPGKKKQAKRLKALQDELKAQQQRSSEGSVTKMRVLERKQQHAKQAHVVLSGGV